MTIRGFTHHGKSLFLKQGPQALAHYLVIVGKKNFEGHIYLSSGIVIKSSEPFSGADLMENFPPKASSRIWIPTRPRPPWPRLDSAAPASNPTPSSRME